MKNEFKTIITASCYTFVMNYMYPDSTRSWSLKFQMKPEKKVIFSGEKPTRDEIIECLKNTNLPILMIEIFEIIIEDAMKHNVK